MDKNELREQAVFHRNRIRPEDEDIERAGTLLLENVIIEKGAIVAAYWPIGKEFDVRYLIDDLFKAGERAAGHLRTTRTKLH